MDGRYNNLGINSDQDSAIKFNEAGWRIENARVYYPSTVTKQMAYKFVLEAIYDGHLPVTRVIGYNPVTPTVSKSETQHMLSRSPDSLDDKMSIVSNLSKILIIDAGTFKPSTQAAVGEINVGNMGLMYSAQPLRVLSTGHYIMTSTAESSLNLVVNCDTQFRDAQYNYNVIMGVAKTREKSRYTPMMSYHNIIDYVNILPPVQSDESIHLMYNYGMTDEYLTLFFNRLFNTETDIEWRKTWEGLLAC